VRQADLDPLPADHDRAPDGHPPPDGERGGQLWWSGGSGTGSAKPLPGGLRDGAGDGADRGAAGEDVRDRPVQPHGDALKIGSGQIAIFSAALDGTGPYSGPWVSARPGPVPPGHGPPSLEDDPGLLIQAPPTEYKLKIRWYTQLDQDNCFARWLLIPAQASN